MASNRLLDAPAASANRCRACWLGLLFWLTVLPFALKPQLNGNVWSRYMTIESLVERHTLVIERSPFLKSSGSPDIVQFDGHFYSDKPPVLSLAGAVVYAPLTWLGYRFSHSPASFVTVNLMLVALTSTLCAAVTVASLRRLFARLPLAPRAADVLALGCGYGSLLLPYAVTFNNHAVAAGLIAAAFMLLMNPAGVTGDGRRLVIAGVLTGLASVIDLPAGGACLLAFGIQAARVQRRIPWGYAVGAVPALLLHGLVQSMVTGSPLPAEFYPDSFRYPGSYWVTQAGTFRETGPRWRFGLEMLVGPQGWLTLTPVLWLGLIGLLTSLRKTLPDQSCRREAAWTIAAVLLPVLVYYIWLTRRTDFAGQSFGTRHLLAISPLIYYFGVEWLSRRQSAARIGIFGVLMLVGVIYACQGARDPWFRIEGRQEPILRFLQGATLYPQQFDSPPLRPGE